MRGSQHVCVAVGALLHTGTSSIPESTATKVGHLMLLVRSNLHATGRMQCPRRRAISTFQIAQVLDNGADLMRNPPGLIWWVRRFADVAPEWRMGHRFPRTRTAGSGLLQRRHTLAHHLQQTRIHGRQATALNHSLVPSDNDATCLQQQRIATRDCYQAPVDTPSM